MQTTQPRTTHHHEYRLLPAIAVIAIGIIFLMGNLGLEIPLLDSSNWWAWLILVGALAPLTHAFYTYRARGQASAEVFGSLLAGGGVILVAVIFLLGLDWQIWWPLFVILAGLFTLLRMPRHGSPRDTMRDELTAQRDAKFKR